MLQDMIDHVNRDHEECQPPKQPEGVPENQGYQDGQEYQNQILLAA